jgi:hypothetical protein
MRSLKSLPPSTLIIVNRVRFLIEMRAVLLRRVVNSAVWITSGIVVVIIRASVTQGGSVVVWETIGGGMMIYGAGRLVWALIKPSSTSVASL